MTSNIGTEEGSRPSLGFMGGERQPDYTAHLNQFFRPEFLNRLDEVVTFRSLSHDTLSQILDLQLGELYERLNEQKLKLVLSDAARALILQRGYDPINGARPLHRAIERLLTRPLMMSSSDTASRVVDGVVPASWTT